MLAVVGLAALMAAWPVPAQAAAPRWAIATVVDRGAPIGKRIAAARVLGRSRDPRAIQPLLRALGSRDEMFTETVQAALRALDAVPILMAQLGDPASPAEDRRLAATGLRYVRSRQAVPVLLQTLEAADPELRAEALMALDLMEAPERVAPLIVLLKKDPDHAVRYHAANSLGDVRTPEARAALEAQLQVETHTTVKGEIRNSLRRQAAPPPAEPPPPDPPPLRQPRARGGAKL